LRPFSTCCGLNLLSSHLLHTLYTSHLGHHLIDDVQVQAVLGLQLVGHVLTGGGQSALCFVSCKQLHRDAGPISLGPGSTRVVQRLDDTEAKDIKRQADEVLERIYHRTNEIIIDLIL
jgi:hypothetical protein